MPAYMKEITKHKCADCSRNATHEVYNTYNALTNYCCKPHAEALVIKLNSAMEKFNRKENLLVGRER